LPEPPPQEPIDQDGQEGGDEGCNIDTWHLS
jgi:hypothetical protein